MANIMKTVGRKLENQKKIITELVARGKRHMFSFLDEALVDDDVILILLVGFHYSLTPTTYYSNVSRESHHRHIQLHA
nr:hypothetical protein Iba_chr04eCG15590 [Ipomoea batatas]